ncbi:MAG TPA: hypothetical protein VGQ67_00610 [Candidatus Polarisedimenticolia bacterium]|jgi:hypothetical protein|nr:hypothetical protein [Candidatus Polarisedimenticolia bacterium]
MEGRRVRLGDVIDDYCTRCRLIMNHGVVGMVGEEVVKVRCNTCQTEHPYKHARLPKKRRGETDRLFAEVLRGISGPAADGPTGEPAAPGDRRSAAGEPLLQEDTTPAGAAGEGENGEAASGEAASEEAARDGANGDPAPAPSEETHGVRRKLFTIRRHSGGKPPGTGTPGAKR